MDERDGMNGRASDSRSGMLWTPEELTVVAQWDLRAAEVGRLLGRSRSAVKAARWRLRHEQVGESGVMREWMSVRYLRKPLVMKLPFLARGNASEGDKAEIAVDASVAADNQLATWAVVRGDGLAVLGWYSAQQTNSAAAELEAIKSAFSYGALNGSLLTITTDSDAAAAVVSHLAAGGNVETVSEGFHHQRTLTSIARMLKPAQGKSQLRVQVAEGSASANKRSPEGLSGVADRLAWVGMRLAADRIDPAHPSVRRWIESGGFNRSRRRDRLRKAWTRPGAPGDGRLDGTWGWRVESEGQ
ncbi:hypothetical protein ACFFMN_23925 [Planobispora siamensis]|uniref:RNase H type-1 domain-containing protein n=1 Tax=Planobispora siamensis TaxID=936338 RepID=A0A8J3WQ19_9ACTN|nr:hypothetical protein [Planobispora siamensis]GIH95386.1 hypothetical protein Psi01_60160 [Planobispora siamensis]